MGYPKETPPGMKIESSSTTPIITADKSILGKYTSGLNPNFEYKKQSPNKYLREFWIPNWTVGN